MHAALLPARPLHTKLTPISAGMRNGLEEHIIDGLAENEKIVVYPDTKLLDNMRVRTR
ncbi:hypothetical protein N8793_01995 [Pseudomonadales bacterium]|nr:hypothetical protein [Pseudomonadales bacterium]